MRDVLQLALFGLTAALVIAQLPFPELSPVLIKQPEDRFHLSFSEIAAEDVAEFARIARMSWQIRSGVRSFLSSTKEPAVLAERTPAPPPPLAYELKEEQSILPPVAASFADFVAPRAPRAVFRPPQVKSPSGGKETTRDRWLLSLENFNSLKEKP